MWPLFHRLIRQADQTPRITAKKDLKQVVMSCVPGILQFSKRGGDATKVQRNSGSGQAGLEPCRKCAAGKRSSGAPHVAMIKCAAKCSS